MREEGSEKQNNMHDAYMHLIVVGVACMASSIGITMIIISIMRPVATGK